jgi:hypothetical protein
MPDPAITLRSLLSDRSAALAPASRTVSRHSWSPLPDFGLRTRRRCGCPGSGRASALTGIFGLVGDPPPVEDRWSQWAHVSTGEGSTID